MHEHYMDAVANLTMHTDCGSHGHRIQKHRRQRAQTLAECGGRHRALRRHRASAGHPGPGLSVRPVRANGIGNLDVYNGRGALVHYAAASARCVQFHCARANAGPCVGMADVHCPSGRDHTHAHSNTQPQANSHTYPGRTTSFVPSGFFDFPRTAYGRMGSASSCLDVVM